MWGVWVASRGSERGERRAVCCAGLGDVPLPLQQPGPRRRQVTASRGGGGAFYSVHLLGVYLCVANVLRGAGGGDYRCVLRRGVGGEGK